jgi:hypothetical protein
MLLAGKTFYNRLWKKRDEGWEDEGKDVSSYWIILTFWHWNLVFKF